MDIRQVQSAWEANAEAWVRLSQMGCDVLRDLVNMAQVLMKKPKESIEVVTRWIQLTRQHDSLPM